MSFGIKIRNNNGGLLISDTNINRQLIGPVNTSVANWGTDPYAFKNWCTHVATIWPRVAPPMVFLKLPTTAGMGVALSGIINNNNGSYSIYILAAGYGEGVPQFYYTDDFQGVIPSSYGVIVKSSSGALVWSSNVALPSADVVPWSTGRCVTAAASRYLTGTSYSIAATFRSGIGPVGMFPAYSECGCSWFYDQYYYWDFVNIAGIPLYRASGSTVIAQPAIWYESGSSYDGGVDVLASTSCQLIGASYDMGSIPQWFSNGPSTQDREFLLLR